MTKKVLIVTSDFPPYSAPRMGYLCKYLKRYGWEPYIISLYQEPEYRYDYLADPAHTYWTYEIVAPVRKWYHKLLNFFSLYDVYIREKEMAQIGDILASKHHFEVVIGNTCTLKYPLWAARHIAKKNHLPLLIDIRDMPEQIGVNWKFQLTHFKDLILRRIILKSAEKITIVSSWHRDELKRKYHVTPEVICNGFDDEISKAQVPQPDSRFRIVYAGKLYNINLRNPDLLFGAMKRLADERLITPDNFCVDFYSDETGYRHVYEMAQKFHVESFLEFHGFIPPAEIPEKLSQASVLLLLTNKPNAKRGPFGILTGKFFDYLAMRRPILCVRSDEGLLEEAVKDSRCGLAARTLEETYDFIRGYFEIWQKNGVVPLLENGAHIQQFSREKQALRFMEIFEQLSAINTKR